MVAAGPTWSEMASSVFSPIPVLITTVSSSGSSCPVSTSFFRQPTVVPPAVSVKMPSVRANSKILFAARNSEIAFGLLTDDSSVQDTRGVTARDLFPELFGVRP